MDVIGEQAPGYGPHLFLRRELERAAAAAPRLADQASFPVGTGGARRLLQVSAVAQNIGEKRAVVTFVDNDRREVYGERYIDADAGELDELVARFAAETTAALRSEYLELAAEASRRGESVPSEATAAERLRRRVAAAVAAPFP
jgi:hypothetical protein